MAGRECPQQAVRGREGDEEAVLLAPAVIEPDEQPLTKRSRPSAADSDLMSLVDRLSSVLCCTVCLDLPKMAVFQCSNGHLMCAGCFVHLLADARLKEEQATCPNCRCEISRSLCCRSLAVEKAVSELPTTCDYCQQNFPRDCLALHQREHCHNRPTHCRYCRIGCRWKGPFHEVPAHEATCVHPLKPGGDLMGVLADVDAQHHQEVSPFQDILQLLSLEKIGYTEVQFRSYHTDDFITRLYYETPHFMILNHTWVLKARVNDSERNQNLSSERTLSFQLLMRSKLPAAMDCAFLLLRAPYEDVPLRPVVYRHTFSGESPESPYLPLPITDAIECNRLLAAKNFSVRLFFFQATKL
uniref:zinc finger TRAF-type-containing protein 1-A-like isoform X3 n=2 Tax=Myxine glutinosa TaxID=7769 RepID=UPI00358DDF9E